MRVKGRKSLSRSFSFVHVADTHLGFRQYGLNERWEDFSRVFVEIVDKTIELKPEFMIISGDVFQDPRPTNRTLEVAIMNLVRLREEGIKVLGIGGSHDSSPNVTTGTILRPLDGAKLLYYLPDHKGGSYTGDCYYVYGIPSFRTSREGEVRLREFFEEKPPSLSPSLFNICVFHMALNHPKVPKIPDEYTLSMSFLPKGFDYYAGGHVHRPLISRLDGKLGGGILAYSGCTETTSTKEAEYSKGFFFVKVDKRGGLNLKRIELKGPRRFEVIEIDATGRKGSEITKLGCDAVKRLDGKGKVIVVILRGELPPDVRKMEIDSAKIRRSGRRALHIKVSNQMKERGMTEEQKRRIIEGRPEDLKRRAYEYLVSVLQSSEGERAENVARIAVDLIEPLKHGEKRRVLELLEKL
ncbi:MAG: exonuclease SbcCD subunit D [Candidatus Bathyarchaeia archaeon]